MNRGYIIYKRNEEKQAMQHSDFALSLQEATITVSCGMGATFEA